MTNKSRVLVTGSTGLLGPYVINDLIKKGYENITVLIRSGKLNAELKPFANNLKVVKGDILELFPLTEEIAIVDYVIHVAAMVSFDPKDKQAMYDINVNGTANVVNLCLEHGIKKLVHVSSVAAIGRPDKRELLSETTAWSDSKYNPYYGVTKYKSELEVWRGYTEGLHVAIVNPSIILGRGDYSRSSLKMVKLIKRGLSHYPVGKVGIVDVRDVASMCTLLMESDINGERYIATAESITYKSLFEKMAAHLGSKPPSKAMSPLMGSIVWRLEKIRSLITGSSPIVTKETIASSSYTSEYDTSKSQSLPDFTYRNSAETIKWSCDGLV